MRYSLYPESYAAHEASMRDMTTRMPYPVSEVSSYDAWPEDAPEPPTAVLSLAGFALDNSWKVITQYSRGMMPHRTTGKPGALRHLIGLRFGGHPMTRNQAYAVYTSSVSKTLWTWDSVWIFGPELPPFGQCGATGLKTYLAGMAFVPEEELTSWILSVKSGHEESAMMAAERTRVRKEIAARLTMGQSPSSLAMRYGVSLEEIQAMADRLRNATRGEGL